MNMLHRAALVFVLATSAAVAATPTTPTSTPASDDSAAILQRVKDFYTWSLTNSKSVSALEPKIKDVKGSSKFYLDVSNLKAFTAAFQKSGSFAPEFSAKVEKYYLKYQDDFSKMSKKEFDQVKKDGRGPMMDTEDMDIFFCAQEYENKPSFVKGMTLADLKVTDTTATAEVVSPMSWKTEFGFKKVGPRWLISSYCVYK